MLNRIFNHQLTAIFVATVTTLAIIASTVGTAMAVGVEEILTPHYNPNINLCGTPTTGGTGSVPSGGKIYMLGDSITVRSEKALRDKFTTRQITPFINGSVSRSWNGGGSNTTSQGSRIAGKDAIVEDESKNPGAVSSAGGIVIALGTNGGVGSNPIDSMVTEIRKVNSGSPIWFVNIVGSAAWPNNISGLGAFNTQLNQKSATLNYKVINWFAAVNPGGDQNVIPTADVNKLLDDGIHPNTSGVDKLSSLVVDGITAGAATTPTSSQSPQTCCATGGAGSPVAGNDNPEKVWNYLVGNMQFSAPQAAGIMGNIQQESGFSSTIVNKTSGAYGLIQWFAGREKALENYARSVGKDKGDLGMQLDFMKQELESPYYKTRVLDAIRATQSMEESTRIWLERFEIPCLAGSAGCAREMRVRVPFAQNWLTKFGSNTGGAVASAPAAACGGAGGGGVGVSPDGFTFPLRTDKATIISKGWCYKSKSNCHHDYKAADIFAPTGTEVIAARSGVVVMAKTGPGRVVIKSDDGNIYYYTHMLSDSLVVQKGQSVTAGTTLGRVGTAADAQGTPPHLHIDSLPGAQYDARPGCKGSACRSLPFFELQPVLTAAFEALP